MNFAVHEDFFLGAPTDYCLYIDMPVSGHCAKVDEVLRIFSINTNGDGMPPIAYPRVTTGNLLRSYDPVTNNRRSPLK